MATLLVLGNTSTRKADYIMPDCIDIQCEIQPVPFSYKPFGVAAHQVGIDERRQLHGAISAPRTHNGLHLRVAVSPFKVGGTLFGRACIFHQS